MLLVFLLSSSKNLRIPFELQRNIYFVVPSNCRRNRSTFYRNASNLGRLFRISVCFLRKISQRIPWSHCFLRVECEITGVTKSFPPKRITPFPVGREKCDFITLLQKSYRTISANIVFFFFFFKRTQIVKFLQLGTLKKTGHFRRSVTGEPYFGLINVIVSLREILSRTFFD